MTTWTREHDAVIARECEGKTVYTWDDLMPIYANTEEPSWPNRSGIELHRKRIPDELFHMKHPSCDISRYSTDLAACFRAAEAWKAIDVDRRGYSTMSASSSQPTAICWTSPRCLVGEDLYQGQGKEPSQALAWALYNAVKGIK